MLEGGVTDAPGDVIAEFGDTETGDEELEGGALTDVDEAVVTAEEDVLTAKLPMLDTGVHWEVAGAGCASGVTGSPWWNVDVP